MVDERRVRRLLQAVTNDLTFLAARRGQDREAILADEDRLAAIKYVFVTAIEGCLDVAQHLCAAAGWGPPPSNAGAMRLLADHGVLDPVLGEEMARAVGFRNVLVRGYVSVDDRQVVAFLDRLDDLQAYVSAVAGWLEGQPRSD